MSEAEFEGKNLVELLDLLEPVPEPRAISMWPETQGWIWLGLTVLVLILWGFWRWRRAHKANAYRRAALGELAGTHDNPVAIAAILRRAALAAYPRRDVARLGGDEWLAFLDACCDRQAFVSDKGRAMQAAPYRPDASAIDGLGQMARDWVRHHKSQVRA